MSYKNAYTEVQDLVFWNFNFYIMLYHAIFRRTIQIARSFL